MNDELEETFLHAAMAYFQNYWFYTGWTEKNSKPQPGQAVVSFVIRNEKFSIARSFLESVMVTTTKTP